MNDLTLVRVCPVCDRHPSYLPGALQCVECGGHRPRRTSSVTWHSCVKGASEAAQEALDCEFHSARPNPVTAVIDIECHFLGTYRILGLKVSGGGSTFSDGLVMVIGAFTRFGLSVTT